MNNTNARSLVQGLIGDFSSRLPIIFFFFFRSRKGREGATRAKRHRPPFIFSRPHVVPWRCGAGGDARA